MNILIVGLVNNDQLVRVKEEAEKRSHSLEGTYASHLTIQSDKNHFNPTLRGKSLEEYDLIYLWAVGKRRWEWYTTALYLWEKFGTVIVNSKVVEPGYKYYLTPAIDYLKQAHSNLPFPRSAIIFDEKSVDSVISNFAFPLILKTSGGRQGRGVFKIENIEELKQKTESLKETSPSFVIRDFIPNDGDIRVFTIGYKALGAMWRSPAKGDFRSNISQGGEGAIFDLDKNPTIKKIAEDASKITKTEIAGVDIMINKETKEPFILEINPGPQFTGFEKYTGINTAKEIILYFESLLPKA